MISEGSCRARVGRRSAVRREAWATKPDPAAADCGAFAVVNVDQLDVAQRFSSLRKLTKIARVVAMVRRSDVLLPSGGRETPHVQSAMVRIRILGIGFHLQTYLAI